MSKNKKRPEKKAKTPEKMNDREYAQYLRKQAQTETYDFTKAETRSRLERLYRNEAQGFNRNIRRTMYQGSASESAYTSDDTKQIAKRRLTATLNLAERVQS